MRRTADEAGSQKAAAAAADRQVIKAKFWRNGLITNRDGAPKRCLANVMHVFALHPDWCGVLAWDAFGLSVVALKKPPMRPQDAPAAYTCGDWTDEDSARTVAWFASVVGFEPAVVHVDQAVSAVARKSVVHPVRDWLSSLTWDGTPRLDGFASRYLGASPSVYATAVGRRWMIAAVARVFEPGCKVDSLLGLEGEQGIGKSSALRLLAGPDWFADTGIALGDKDSYQALRRKWIYEFAELASIRGREIERVKSFLSSQCDTFRASYGRRTQDHPRQVVFAGSTNEEHYLSDPTGARRFWPLRCGAIDLAALKSDRDQLWAEARAAYDAGEAWHLDTPELRARATDEQAEREQIDDWVMIVDRWLGAQAQLRIVDEGLTTADVLLGALAFSPERITQAATSRAGHVLRKLGFEPRQQRVRGQNQRRERRYFRRCDDGRDGGAASAGSSHTSQPVTPRYTYAQDGVEGAHAPPRSEAKPGETPVTSDTDEERDAIRGEGFE